MATSTEFSDKTALITGGSRGIGRATTLRLASEGARVAINFVSREAEARETLAEVEEAGGTGIVVQGDVSQPEEAEAMVATTREALGPIDFLAHCAGMAVVESADETRWESWKRTMEVNLDGTFNMIFAVKDEMVQRKFGRIVAVSSTAALRARPSLIAYSASKAGMISLVRSCGEAWAHHNVRINCLLPGVTETENAKEEYDAGEPGSDDRSNADAAHRPAGRDGLHHSLSVERRVELYDRTVGRRQRRARLVARVSQGLFIVLFSGEEIVSVVSQLGITHVIWVPDTDIGRWEPALDAAPQFELIRVCREGEAWPLAAGLIVGGKRPLLVFQTTGLYESGDALRNVVFDLGLPIIAIVGARNWLNEKSKDTAKTFAEPILGAWGIDYQLVDSAADKPKLASWLESCLENSKPGIVLLAE